MWLNHIQQIQDSELVFDAHINVKFNLSGYTTVSQAKNSRGVKVMNVKLSKVMNVSVEIKTGFCRDKNFFPIMILQFRQWNLVKTIKFTLA